MFIDGKFQATTNTNSETMQSSQLVVFGGFPSAVMTIDEFRVSYMSRYVSNVSFAPPKHFNNNEETTYMFDEGVGMTSAPNVTLRGNTQWVPVVR